MKKFFFFLALFICAVYWMGCRKCYHCQNICQKCVLTNGTSVTSEVVCSNNFSVQAEYEAAITADTSQGYICTATSSTYSEDFCVNKPGEKSYPDYYTQGGRVTCTPK